MTSIKWPKIQLFKHFHQICFFHGCCCDCTVIWRRDAKVCLRRRTKNTLYETGWQANAFHGKSVRAQKHTLHLVSVNDCLAVCIKPQPKPEFAWKEHMLQSHEMVMWPAFIVWAESSPVLSPVSTSLLQSGLTGGTVFENTRLSTFTKK